MCNVTYLANFVICTSQLLQLFSFVCCLCSNIFFMSSIPFEHSLNFCAFMYLYQRKSENKENSITGLEWKCLVTSKGKYVQLNRMQKPLGMVRLSLYLTWIIVSMHSNGYLKQTFTRGHSADNSLPPPSLSHIWNFFWGTFFFFFFSSHRYLLPLPYFSPRQE